MSTRIDMHQHLTFLLGKETYALDISNVREVLELTEVTAIPRTPQYMCGVINLRGHAVPVVDMRMKFGMEACENTVNTCIIIIDVTYGDTSAVIGGMVDGVSEVMELTPDKIEAAPKMGAGVDVEFIKGMGRVNDDFIIIIDIDKVFSEEELSVATGMADHEENAEQPPAEQAAAAAPA